MTDIQLGFRKPNNVTSQGGSLGAEFFTVGGNATAAEMLPGILVKRDTNDNMVMEGDASGNSIGFLSYEGSPSKPATIYTAFARGDTVAVNRGAGRRQMAYLADQQSVVNGQPLTGTAAGQLAAGTPGTDDIVADADETINASTGAAVIFVITRK